MDRDEMVRRHMSSVYDDIWECFSAKRSRPWDEVIEFVERSDGRTAVDIGSGNGRNAVVLADRGFDVVAVDRCVPLMRATFTRERSGDGEIRLVQGDMGALPLADSSFDVAVMIAGLHHFPSEEGRRHCLEEMRRVMRAGARGLVTSWGRHQEEVPWGSMRTSIETEWGPVELDGEWDRFVPWKDGEAVRWRFYHYMSEEELGALAGEVFYEVRTYRTRGNVLAEVLAEGEAP